MSATRAGLHAACPSGAPGSAAEPPWFKSPLAAGFPEDERRRLLAMPRIGPRVVERLESLGFHSIESIQRAGLDAVIDTVCSATGSPAWANRRRALAQALGVLGSARVQPR